MAGRAGQPSWGSKMRRYSLETVTRLVLGKRRPTFSNRSSLGARVTSITSTTGT